MKYVKKMSFVFVLSVLLLVGCTDETPPTQKGPLKLEIIHHNQTNFNLPEQEITSLAAYKGKIWAGSSRGLFVFDGSHWKVYVKENTNVLGSNIIEKLIVSDDILWVSTDNGACRYDNISWQSLFSAGRARVAVGLKGSIAIGTASGIEYAGLDGTLKNLGKSNARLVDNEVNALAFDSEGNLWVGTRAGMALLEEGLFKNYTGPAKQPMGTSLIDIPANPINCQLVGNNISVVFPYDKLLAIGTTSGLTITDMKSTYRNYFATHTDWFQRGGRIVEEQVAGNSPLQSNVINDLKSTDNHELLFVATNMGLAILRNNGSWIDLSVPLEGFVQQKTNALAYLDGDLWVGTDDGIYQIKEVSKLIRNQD